MGAEYLHYTPELGDAVCELVQDNHRLTEIGAMPGMPSTRTIYNWRVEHSDFAAKFEMAQLENAARMADEIIAIADDGKNDWMTRQDGSEEFNREHAMRSRLRVDTRKWLMSKLLPRKFGDKLELEHSGEVKVTRVVFGDQS